MNCNEIRERISSMLDHELSAEDSAVVTEHLAGCPECMRVFEAFHAISVSLEELEDVPEGFTEAVMHKINTPAPVKKRRPGYFRLASLAACLALVIFTGSRFVTSHLQTDGRHIQDTSEYARVTHQTPKPTPTPDITPEIAVVIGDGTSPALDIAVSEAPDANASAPVTAEVIPVSTPISTAEAVVVTATPAPSPAPTATPRPTPTPIPDSLLIPETLTALSDLLYAAEEADFNLFTEEPDYELTVQDKNGNDVTLQIWLDGDRIYCKNLVEGTAWYAVGTTEDLKLLTESEPAVSPVPSPEVSQSPQTT